MRRKRSSPTSSSIAASRSAAAICSRASRSRPSSSCLRWSRSFRRNRSMARCFAVAISQAPGLRGIPDCGHCSSAATRASCARSSGRPTSRTIRARPAMSLADSILHTASIVLWVESAPAGFVIVDPPAQASVFSLQFRVLPLQLRAKRLLPGSGLLGRKDISGRVRFFEHLANFDFTLFERSALEPFNRLFFGLHLNQPKAGDQLFRLGKRPIRHPGFFPQVVEARAFRARLESFAREHHASLYHLFVELTHLGKLLLTGQHPRLALFARLDQHPESHSHISLVFGE